MSHQRTASVKCVWCHFGKLFCVVLVFFLFNLRLFGQGGTGTIQGTVADSSGAVIPGAIVTALNTETGLRRTVTTGGTGFYLLPNLPPGKYQVEVTMAGFQKAVYENVVLAVAQQLVVNSILQIGEITQQVTVSAEAAAIDTTTSDVSNAITPARVQELPLLGRDFRDLTSLVPGVIPIPASYSSGSVTGSIRSFRTSIAGGRVAQTAYYLDGLYLNDASSMAPAGVSGTQLGVDLVREFRVLVNSYSAEYGRNGSGAITMVSRSGTNSFHGSVFEFFRNDKLNARNFFDGTRKAPLRRNQFGFSLGGPVLKDKTFFYLNWEGMRIRDGVTLVSFVPDLNARKGFLPNAQGTLVPLQNNIGNQVAQGVMNLYPLPNTNISCGTGCLQNNTPFSSPIRDDLANLRVDQKLGDNHSMFVRYTFDNGLRLSPRFLPTFLQSGRTRSQWTSLQEDWIVTSSILNTFRAGFVRSSGKSNEMPAQGTTIDPILLIPGRWDVPSYNIANYTQIGQQQQSSGGGNTYNWWQFSDDMVLTHGSHTVKFGARFEYYQNNDHGNRLSKDGNASGSGFWTFLTLQDFFAGKVFQLRDSVGIKGTAHRLTQKLIGLFVQDDYRVLSNLTLNLGLRVEYLTPPKRNPAFYHMVNFFSDTGNSPVEHPYVTDPVVSPRVGLAWTPLKTRETFVVRAGAGIFYDQLSAGFYSNGNTINFPYATQTTLGTGTPFPDPYPTKIYPSPALANSFSYEPHQNVPTFYQYNLSLANLFFNRVQVTASYVGNQGRHNYTSGNVNTFPRSIVNGHVFYDFTKKPRNPNYIADIYDNATQGSSYYNSFQMNVKSPITGGSSVEGSYTLSKCIDTGSVDNTADMGALREKFIYDVYDMKNNRGRCNMDIRQRLAMNVLYDLPFKNMQGFWKALLDGWSLSSIVQISDGAPFTPKISFPRSRQALQPGNSRQERPNLVPGVVISDKVFPGNPIRYYDPKIFVLQPEGFLGDAGRNLITGPGLAMVDLSVARAIPLKENIKLQFRAEFFNLFNRVNFGLPNSDIFTNTSGVPNATAGRITNTSTNSRNIQLALKLVF